MGYYLHLLNAYFSGDSCYQLAKGVEKGEIKVFASGGGLPKILDLDANLLIENAKKKVSLQHAVFEIIKKL